MNKSKIEWTEYTWNPVSGCSPISEGCEHCYAARTAKRLVGRYGYPIDEPFRVTLHPDRLDEPLHWRKSRIVFVCSMSDLFHDQVPFEFIKKIFHTVRSTLNIRTTPHRFIFLTKRPKRMLEFWNWHFNQTGKWPNSALPEDKHKLATGIWIGVTAENQLRADERIPILLQIPAAVHFISCEPLLGSIDLHPIFSRSISNPFDQNKIDWVIMGAETGPGRRLMKISWGLDIASHCQTADVPLFYKQGPSENYFPELLVKMPTLLGKKWNQMPNYSVLWR